MVFHASNLKQSSLCTCCYRFSGRGFSLLELIAVIAVVSILSAIAFGILDGVRERQMRMRTEAELASLRGALDRYRLEFHSYPVIDSGSEEQRSALLLDVLVYRREPDGSGLSKGGPLVNLDDYTVDENGKFFMDAWGNPLHYSFSDSTGWKHESCFLVSAGPDGVAKFPDFSGNYDPEADENTDNIEGFGR